MTHSIHLRGFAPTLLSVVRSFLILVVAGISMIPGLAHPADPALNANAEAEQAIRAALANWTRAANQQDWRSALQVWAPDLVGWGTEGPDDTYQREADFAAHPVPTRTTYALTINEVMVDGSLAIVRDSWTETTRQDNGPDKVTTYRSFEVWRRQLDNSWKISRWIDGPPMHVPGK
jgi:ketosteroid isomerase-like protein